MFLQRHREKRANALVFIKLEKLHFRSLCDPVTSQQNFSQNNKTNQFDVILMLL